MLALTDQNNNRLDGDPYVIIAPIDDSFFGEKSLRGLKFTLEAGEYRVTVNLDGFDSEEEKVTIEGGKTNVLRLKLKPKPDAPGADPPANPRRVRPANPQ